MARTDGPELAVVVQELSHESRLIIVAKPGSGNQSTHDAAVAGLNSVCHGDRNHGGGGVDVTSQVGLTTPMLRLLVP